ncbi:hypothetical protein ACP4OV_023132 [Aristida adscensionis]
MGGMEAALVSGILKVVGMKLAPLVIKEFSSIAGVSNDLEELRGLVEEINTWLQQVGDKARGGDRSSNWLKKLKDTAYDAEDIVHEFYMEAEKHDTNVVGVKNIVVKYLWTKPKSVVFECKTAHKIKAIRKRFDAIVKARSDYSTIANSMPLDSVPHISKTIGEVPLWTNVDKTSIFGRDQVKDQIISELVETKDIQKIKIVSVIGLGGSGKTTLAKLVFNDCNTIKEHFELTLWVHVSREFSVEKLVEKLYEAIAGDKSDQLPLQHVSRTISDKLAGKKFLVVLDDVWTEDRIHWEQFMIHLKSGAPGSSILLTTRSRKVAEAVDSAHKCVLEFLSEEDSWKVFQQSFGMHMEGLDTEFLQVGTEIVKKCGGVPLAIKVLAGSLRGMKRIVEWQSIRDSNLLDVEDKEDRVSACLLLSYYHLPYYLKHCFSHCSIFPRGYAINKRHLISQWIAHGLVNPTSHGQQPEDVGEDYFDCLLQVGFLQDAKVDWQLGHTSCIMHDLIHDLSRKILQDEFVSEIATTNRITRCRYLSLTARTGKVESKLFGKVRAIYVSRGNNLVFDRKLDKQCCVRTIILDHTRVALLPLFVSKFENLGYLEISHVNCEELPEAISHCWNLQAIHVIHCMILATLPESIGKLKKLRTLELNHCWNLMGLPQSIGGCDSLQSLYLQDCPFSMTNIPNSLGNAEKLRVLSIVDCRNLQELPSSENFGNLCNLHTVTLNNCQNIKHLPHCINLFDYLEHVDLAKCEKLLELPEGVGNLKRLRVLNLEGCHSLCGLPAGVGQLTHLWKLGLFVVGDSTEHASISELENLDKLKGKLQIKNISHVKDSEDAKKACLKKKSGLRKLSLDWFSRRRYWKEGLWRVSFDEKEWPTVGIRTEGELCLNMEKDLDLLNSLEPPSEIEKLRISSYRGMHLPCWMTKQIDSCVLSDKHMLKQSRPPQFSHLTNLVLENLPNLEHLQGLLDLPVLNILKLKQIPNLAELLSTRIGLANGEEAVEVQFCFPHLSTVVISDCPKLIVKPYFPPSLIELTVEGSNEQLLSSGSFFHPRHAHVDESLSSSCIVDVKALHLKQLKLGRMTGSSSGWEVLQHLTGLHELEIFECKDLRQLPESMRSLTSLHRLIIEHCGDLCVLPEWLGELQSLQHLQISYLPLLSNIPQSIERLTFLQSLRIDGINSLHQLPEQLGELRSLRAFHIFGLPALTSLPECMQRLTSLRSLGLCRCVSLTQLPESLGELCALRSISIQLCPGITSLPRSIQRLTALEHLMINRCPELLRRCKEGIGEDWHLVSHIPDLQLLGASE